MPMPTPSTTMTMIRPMYRHYGSGDNNRQGPHRRPRRAATRPFRGRRGARGAVVAAALIALASVPAAAQDATQDTGSGSVWDRAVDAVQYNRMGDAIPLLELVISQDPTRVEAIRMLATALEQTGKPDQAEQVLRDGMGRQSIDASGRGRLAFDLALLLGRRDRADEAVAMYTTALEYDSSLASAYLNRANTQVKTQAYEAAVRDYEYYLALRPGADQRPQIERMMDLLRNEIEAQRVAQQEAEQRRQQEAEAQRIAAEEQQRREEEQRRQAEARRQEMLSSVLQSLGNAEQDATNFQAENEDIRTYDEELDIVD